MIAVCFNYNTPFPLRGIMCTSFLTGTMGLTGFNATYYPCPCVRIRLCNRRITGNTDHSSNRIQMRCLRVLRFHLRNTLKFLRSPLILKYLKCGCHVFIVDDNSIVTIFYNFNVLFHHIPFTVSDK